MAELCTKCGQRPRQEFKYWCTSCITLPRRHREQYLREMAAADMAYVPAYRPPPPPPAPGRPAVPCPRCQVSLWTDRGNGEWACGSCNFVPGESGVRTVPAYYSAPDLPPVPPAPAPVCNVCGPTTWVPREDGSTQCRLCGAVRG